MVEKQLWNIFGFYIAYGSTCELETQLLLSGDLGYIKDKKFNNLHKDIGEIERMLKSLINSLETKRLKP
jgi:four helix bundle protein